MAARAVGGGGDRGMHLSLSAFPPGENQRDRAQNIAAINDNNGRTVPKGLNRMAEWTSSKPPASSFSLFVPRERVSGC